MRGRGQHPWRVRLLALTSLACGLLVLPGISQENLVDLAFFRSGCQALEDERFGSAADSFRATWEERVGAGAGDVEKDLIASRLLEALVRNGETRAAIVWMDTHPTVNPSPETIRWKALALHEEGRYAEAAVQYSILQNTMQALPPDLQLGMASCFSRSGKNDLAYDLISDLPPAETVSDAVEVGSILAQAGKYDEALDSLLEPKETTTDELALAQLRLKTTLLLKLNRGDEAIALLFENIETAETEQDALTGLLLLEAARVSSGYPPLKSHLGDWSENRDHPASDAARFFAPLLLKPETDPAAHLRKTLENSASSLLKAEAQARLPLATDAPENPFPESHSASLLGGDTRTAFEKAATQFRSDNFDTAAEEFSRLAGRQIGENRVRSLFNAAIAYLRSGDLDQFKRHKEILRTENPKSDILGDLEYIEGLSLAAQADARAAVVLKQFTQEYPDHRSQIDALLALAEFHLNQAPARPQAARELFENLRVRPLTLEQNERFDYASLWLERVENNPSVFRSAAERFLLDWPNSKYRPEISMLLGRAYYAARDFNEASVLFHFVATEHPSSPFAPMARFFEIKANGDPLEAEKGWERLIVENPQLADQARHELGMLHLAEGRFEEARQKFKEVAETVELDNPLHFAALGDIGYTYYREALLAKAPAPLLEQASEAFAKVVQQPKAPEKWVFDAAVRRGKCLEMLGKPSVALEIYESIVQRSRERDSLSSATLSPEARNWVFRAGFAAIDILTSEENWKSAIRIADALAQEDGPRAIKASRLAERMRLEHWIWD